MEVNILPLFNVGDEDQIQVIIFEEEAFYWLSYIPNISLIFIDLSFTMFFFPLG